MSESYELALNTVREAMAKMNEIRRTYRAGLIRDDEFLAAKKVYDEADKAFELAYTKEQKRGD